MVATVNTEISQTRVFALGNYPTEFVRGSQTRLNVLASKPTPVRVFSSRVFALGAGRVNDPNIRAWTFTLDGHDFYVLRLGNRETLLYDVYSEQWCVWGSGTSDLWKAYTGSNWIDSASQSLVNGSAVIVGDDGNGSIYFLNPDGDTDDDSVFGASLPRSFIREAQGIVNQKGYDRMPCFGVQLLGSIGDTDNALLSNVTLSYSDDRGESYVDAGTIALTPGDTEDRLYWRSLGSIRSPGRLFKITDDGALKRIDSLDMDGE